MIRKIHNGLAPLQQFSAVEKGFWNAAIPSVCVVPLQQHRGSRVHPMVSVGDVVREGMIIADGDGRLALPVHAPIPGRIIEVGDMRLLDNTESVAIAIELSGEFDRLGKKRERRDWQDFSPEDVREIIRAAGVVAGGRWPVPAHQYLRRSFGYRKPVLVLDLAETEPWLSADVELVRVVPDEIAEGLRVIRHLTDVEQIHVVAARQNWRVARALQRELRGVVRFHRVSNWYPGNLEQDFRKVVSLQRSDEQEEQELLRVTADTVHSVFEAVVLGKPQLDRIVSVGGGGVVRPAHLRVRYGTPIRDILEECDGLRDDAVRIVAGGALTGKTVHNIGAPITKTTSAILALTAEEIHEAPERRCIGCGTCTRSCPVGLNPRILQDLIRADRLDDAAAAGVDRCVECGICSHVCPSRIPLVELMRRGKKSSEAAS